MCRGGFEKGIAMRRGTVLALLGALILVLSCTLAPAFAQGLSDQEFKAFHERAEAFWKDGHYDKALAVAEEWLKAAKKAEAKKPGFSTATALGGVSWYAHFAKRPERALEASERALALTSVGDPRLCRGGSSSLTYPAVH